MSIDEKVIRRIFELLEKGYDEEQIAATLNAEGFEAPPWSQDRVQSMLNGPSVLGQTASHGPHKTGGPYTLLRCSTPSQQWPTKPGDDDGEE